MARKTTSERFTPKRRAARPHHVAVVAFDGVVLADLATPCEVLGRARTMEGLPAYAIRVCSPRARVGSEHVGLAVRWRLSALRSVDTILVPGLDDLSRAVPEEVLAELRRALRRGARIASICTGAFVLAAAGILDGRAATTHWLAAPELARRYPRVRVDPNVLYVDEGKVLTSAGAAAGLDLCLHLVRRDYGADVAARTARAVVMPLERAGGQAQFIAHEAPLAAEPMRELLDWIAQNLTADLALRKLARRAAMSLRTFCRRFREQVGVSPAVWIARARVTRAQRLLETTKRSIEDVASDVGFGSATVMRDHFRRVVGVGPKAYREAFAGEKRTNA